MEADANNKVRLVLFLPMGTAPMKIDLINIHSPNGFWDTAILAVITLTQW